MSITSRLFVPFLHFMAGGSNHIDRTYDQPVASADEDRQGSGDLFLIDGNSLAYRAFFALPESIATSDGRPTNAIYGFASMMVKVLTDFRPAGRRGRLGRRDVGPGEDLRALQGAAILTPRPAQGAVAAPGAALGCVRVRERPCGRLGGRRRDRDDGQAGARAGDPGDGRDRRSRCLPAGRRRGPGDVDLARGHRHEDLRPRCGGRALRGRPGARPRPDRPQGRHLRQHPRRPRDRREDRIPAPADVRVARGGAREHRIRSPVRSGSRT